MPSTDTRDALIARLDEQTDCNGEAVIYLRADDVDAVRRALTVAAAARLLREDGERETKIRAEVRAEFEQESRYHQGDLDMAEARGYVRGKSEVVRTPPAIPDRRAALSALYLEAHRAGVEAALEVAAKYIGQFAEPQHIQSILRAEARAFLADERNWTDPGSPLAAFSAARENGNEARPAPLAWLREFSRLQSALVEATWRCADKDEADTPYEERQAEMDRAVKALHAHVEALAHPDAGSEARERVARIAWDKSEEIYEEHDRTAWEVAGDLNRAEAMELADRILAALRGEEVGG